MDNLWFKLQLDGDLNLPRERYYLGVRKRVATEAVKNSFDETVEELERTTGAHVPKRQAEELVSRAAIDFDAFYGQDTIVPEQQESGDLMVLSVDGKGVVMRSSDLRSRPKNQPKSVNRDSRANYQRGRKKAQSAWRQSLRSIPLSQMSEPQNKCPLI